MKIYLKRIFEEETFSISAKDGTETWGEISGDGVVILPKRMRPSKPTNAIVYELLENGRFKEFFPAFLGRKRRRWKNRGQILEFCTRYRDKLKRPGATFFELEGFVAHLYFRDEKLLAGVYHLDFDEVCSGECKHRIISPE